MRSIFGGIIFTLLSNYGLSQSTYYLVNEKDIKQTLVNPHQNVLKMYDITIDEIHGKAYTSGSQTKYISVIDLNSYQEIGSIQMPFRELNRLACNPVNEHIIAIPMSNPYVGYYINPNSQVIGTYNYNFHPSGITFDIQNNLIFLADGNTINIINGTNFTVQNTINASMQVGGLAIDSINLQLYAISLNLIGGNAVIKIFSLQNYNLVQTINIPSTDVVGDIILDIPNNRIFLLGSNVIKIYDISTQDVQTQYTSDATSGKAYSQLLNTIFMVDEDGYSQQGQGGSFSKFYLYNLTLGYMDSLKMGDKSSQIAIDNQRNLLVFPEMHSGNVIIYHLDNQKMDTVDIGESADEMELSPDKNKLYIVKRLGGSKVLVYDKNTGTFNQLKAGNWPCVAEVDSTLQKLFVLNEFESTLSVFNCTNDQLTNTISLGIPEGRKDAIPTMVFDQVNHSLYVAFPEFEKIIKVNAITESVESSISLPGFEFDEDVHFALGVIQLLPIPTLNQLWVLQKVEKKLKRFDLSTLTFIDSIDIQNYWQNNNTFKENALNYDAQQNLLFLGNKIFRPNNFSLIGNIMPAQKFIGYNKDKTILYGIGVYSDTIRIFEFHPQNFSLLDEKILYQAKTDAMPVFFHDSVNNDFFISEFNYPVLKHYDLDSVLSTTSLSDINNFIKFEVSPNPVYQKLTITFSSHNSTPATFRLLDLMGNEIDSYSTIVSPAIQHEYNWDTKDLSQGIYFLECKTSSMVQFKKIIIVKE